MSDNLLSDRVYNWFVGQMHEGKLRPGESLNRRRIAEQVGVSVAPVLEATVRLEHEGLLETVPRRGTRIRHITSDDVHAQQQFREAVECQAARLSCGDAVTRDAARLLKLARRADDARHANQIDWIAEFAFHGALVAVARCSALTEAFERITRKALYFAANDLMPTPGPCDIDEPHAALLRTLEIAEPEEAADALRRHIRTARVIGPRATHHGVPLGSQMPAHAQFSPSGSSLKLSQPDAVTATMSSTRTPPIPPR